MDIFRTELNPSPSAHKIGLHHPMMTLGSCFADTIGQRLSASKFSISQNPFGTIYNPLSIHKLVLQAVHNQQPRESSYLENNNLALNYDFHSEFAASSKTILEAKLKDIIRHAHLFLKNSKFLFITYGTSWVYEHFDTGEVVANCHKMPTNQFKKVLLTEEKILASFDEAYHAIKVFNPEIRIILTVSPVRHLKDTLELNSLSKSTLRLACHSIAERHKDIEYFPAYEILLDDLRDYRFYSSDMIHPSADAIVYIWKKFSAVYFDHETRAFIEHWENISKALTHQPFQPTLPAHQNFLRETLKRLYELKLKVNISEEIKFIEEQIIES
jgi:hypothetical protein